MTLVIIMEFFRMLISNFSVRKNPYCKNFLTGIVVEFLKVAILNSMLFSGVISTFCMFLNITLIEQDVFKPALSIHFSLVSKML